MKLYSSFNQSKLKTVKSHGQKIEEMFWDQAKRTVTVVKIKRVGKTSETTEWGFAVLHSYNSMFICHYSIKYENFTISKEESITDFEPGFLDCPKAYLDMATETNPEWREFVRSYCQAKKLKSSEIRNGDFVFLERQLDRNDFYEPVSVLQKTDEGWFAVNTSSSGRQFVSIGFNEILTHCPSKVSLETLDPINPDSYGPNFKEAGSILYATKGDRSRLIGRKMTKTEILCDLAVSVKGANFYLPGQSPFC